MPWPGEFVRNFSAPVAVASSVEFLQLPRCIPGKGRFEFRRLIEEKSSSLFFARQKGFSPPRLLLLLEFCIVSRPLSPNLHARRKKGSFSPQFLSVRRGQGIFPPLFVCLPPFHLQLGPFDRVVESRCKEAVVVVVVERTIFNLY